MEQKIEYDDKEKSLEWRFKNYCFKLPESIEQLLEIDNAMQISVNSARIDLILEKQLISVYVKTESYKILILLRKLEDDCFLLDYFCGVQKSIPDQNDLEILKQWCEIKNIQFSHGVRL